MTADRTTTSSEADAGVNRGSGSGVDAGDATPGGGAEEAAAAAPASQRAASSPRRRHLYEIDILRILTFACVIAVHSVSHSIDASEQLVENGFLILVHFTREVFFALTAFVLVLSFLAKPRPLREFWPKRFVLVAVPYVTWSIVYEIIVWSQDPGDGVGDFLADLWRDLYTGGAWYHLYFLLVTMQVYLLMPLLVWLVKKTRGHHWTLLGISFAVQMVLVGSYQYFPALTDSFNSYSRIEFWSYQFLIIAGAVAADHADAFLAWVRAHRPLIGLLAIAGALLSIAVYVINLGLGQSATKAVTALQPVVILWAIPVSLGFLAIGTKWADRRDPASRVARLVDTASDRSFGIFLTHPLLIWAILLVWGDAFHAAIPAPLLSVVVYVLVVIGTVALVEILRRTPLSLALTGRPFRGLRPGKR